MTKILKYVNTYQELPCSIMEAWDFDSFHRVASDKPTVAVGVEVVNQSTTV